MKANMSMVTGTQLELRRMTSTSKPFKKDFGWGFFLIIFSGFIYLAVSRVHVFQAAEKCLL